jgi:hypothetical protein
MALHNSPKGNEMNIYKVITKQPLPLFAVILAAAAVTTSIAYAASPNPVELGAAEDYAILSKSGITTTGVTSVVGNIGVSPIAATAMTGFGLSLNSDGQYSKSKLVTGKIFAADYAEPTPAKQSTAILNMEAAYTDAAGRPADITEKNNGNIGGLTLSPGVYKWSSVVNIPKNVTLKGSADDVWIFQIAKGLNVDNGTQVILDGGAQPKNVFWQVGEQVTLGTTAKFSGVILGKTAIVMKTGAKINGRALAQTAVTMDANTVTQPSM